MHIHGDGGVGPQHHAAQLPGQLRGFQREALVCPAGVHLEAAPFGALLLDQRKGRLHNRLHHGFADNGGAGRVHAEHADNGGEQLFTLRFVIIHQDEPAPVADDAAGAHGFRRLHHVLDQQLFKKRPVLALQMDFGIANQKHVGHIISS